MGLLFETWFVRELRRVRDYAQKPHEFSFWREGPHEIDVLVTGGRGPLLAIECKAGAGGIAASTLAAFRARFPNTPLIVASLKDPSPRRLESGVDILPWDTAIERYQAQS